MRAHGLASGSLVCSHWPFHVLLRTEMGDLLQLPSGCGRHLHVKVRAKQHEQGTKWPLPSA